jgi:hypothetical protein
VTVREVVCAFNGCPLSMQDDGQLEHNCRVIVAQIDAKENRIFTIFPIFF